MLAVGALLACASCGAAPVRWTAGWASAYARFDDDSRDRFITARALHDAGDRLAAREALLELWTDDPENLEVAAWLQDLEGRLLEDGVDIFAPDLSLERHAADDVLRRAYAAHADRSPTVAAYVLAARAETDSLAAETQLGKALELDPTCAWAHYGRAHVLLQDRARADRWSLARAALERALALDAGHLRARRLEAWMLAEEGLSDDAEALLRRWIDRAEDDPRVTRLAFVDARLDLARLLLMRGEHGRAERLLTDLEGEPISRARRLMLLTVARQEGGDALGALDAALRAQGAERGTVLPLVQEALLQELFLADIEVANARWREIASRADETSSVADLLQGLRARVRIERRSAAADSEGENP